MKTRTWKVVPTRETGAQAPYFFVRTTEVNKNKAYSQALQLAKEKCVFGEGRFEDWYFLITLH